MVDLLHGAVQQMLRFGPADAQSSAEQLVWIAACTKTQMVYVVYSLVTTTEPGGLQTAGQAFSPLILYATLKKTQSKLEIFACREGLDSPGPSAVLASTIFPQLNICIGKRV